MTKDPFPLSFGVVNGRRLFLDIAADEYLVIEGDGQPGLAVPDPVGPTLHEATGETAAIQGAREATCPALTSSAAEHARGHPSPVLTFRMWGALRQARRDLAGKPLAELLLPFAAAPHHPVDQTSARVTALAADLWRCRPLVPQPRHCLTDSLALLRLLAARGLSARLVFGAKLDPFAAHCWVQSGEVLLNDHLDHVRQFTPVLVLPS